MSLRDELAEAIDWHIGGEHPFDPHDWRCYDKDRYPGECGCRAALVDDLLPIIERETTRARAEVERLTGRVELVRALIAALDAQ